MATHEYESTAGYAPCAECGRTLGVHDACAVCAARHPCVGEARGWDVRGEVPICPGCVPHVLAVEHQAWASAADPDFTPEAAWEQDLRAAEAFRSVPVGLRAVLWPFYRTTFLRDASTRIVAHPTRGERVTTLDGTRRGSVTRVVYGRAWVRWDDAPNAPPEGVRLALWGAHLRRLAQEAP